MDAGIGKKAFDQWFFAIAGIVAVALALPTALNDLLYALKIPVLATSGASRIIILVSFSLAVLSSFGFDRLTTDWKGGRRIWLLGFTPVMLL